MAVKIVVDSGCDISQEEAKKLNITVLPVKVSFGEETFLDGINLSHEEFYNRLEDSTVLPKTAQVTPYEYEEIFENAKANGDQVIVITLSSKCSGGFKSALLAAADYDDIVYVVDSLNVSIGEQILVRQAIKYRDQGLDGKTMYDKLRADVKNMKVIALLDTLEYLKRGGRISKTVAFIGGILSIKPVVAVENGEVKLKGKVRGAKNGHNKLKELIAETRGIDESYPFGIGYTGHSPELMDSYFESSKETFENYKGEIYKTSIGCTIGVHVGPDCLCIGFFQKKEHKPFILKRAAVGAKNYISKAIGMFTHKKNKKEENVNE